jgi:hypothetical protein
MENNHQRVGAKSNTQVGRDFEEATRQFFMERGLNLLPNFVVPVGYLIKKNHKFDLGSDSPPTLVECKSNTWTKSGKRPSAKIRGLNEVMLLFSVTPSHYRKILFMDKHLHPRRNIGLAEHYIKTQKHLIGEKIEVWEFDSAAKRAEQLL